MCRQYLIVGQPLGGQSPKGDPQDQHDYALGRSQGGFGIEIHLVSDGAPTALLYAHARQRHELPVLEQALTAAPCADQDARNE